MPTVHTRCFQHTRDLVVFSHITACLKSPRPVLLKHHINSVRSLRFDTWKKSRREMQDLLDTTVVILPSRVQRHCSRRFKTGLTKRVVFCLGVFLFFVASYTAVRCCVLSRVLSIYGSQYLRDVVFALAPTDSTDSTVYSCAAHWGRCYSNFGV